MRQVVALVSMLVVIICGSAVAAGQETARAQEATPRGGSATAALPAVRFLAFAAGGDLASSPGLGVFRVHLGPGAVLPLNDDAIGGLVIVEPGSVAVEADATLTAARVVALGETMAISSDDGAFLPVVEESAAGEHLTLNPGDVIHLPSGITAMTGQKPPR